MKLGALIPIRMNSERLPGKALKEICGRPVVLHLLDRVFASRHLIRENVIVCTTPHPANDKLAAIVAETGARVFRGSEDDIIDRFRNAVHTFAFDAFLQIDGDDPCSDTLYMDLCMDQLLANENLGIVYGEGLPLGLSTKAIRSSALERVWQFHLSQKNDTGFIYYFTKTDLCNSLVIGPQNSDHIHPTARLTLDYEEDFEFFSALFNELYSSGEIFGITEIVSLLRRRPEMVEINSGLADRYWARTREKAVLEYCTEDGRTMKIEV